MRVLFLTTGSRIVASSRARVYSYLPYLRKNKFKVFVMCYTPSWLCRKILFMKRQGIIERLTGKIYSSVIILFMFMIAPFFNIVYIQKIIFSKFIIKILKSLNKNIIFDFDDAIFIYKDITHLLEESACIVVSNKYLKEFISGYSSKSYELITPVKLGNCSYRKDNHLITLGWIGSPETARYLYPLICVFRSLKEKFKNVNIELMGIHRDSYLGSLSDIKITQWSVEEEEKYLGRISIGIMPLMDDEWSKGKGGYKLLQYMAFGVPSVASPVGINRDIIKSGINGFFANTPDEWLDRISLLIEDAPLRQRMGQESLRLVERLYSYSVTTPKLIEILNCVANRVE